MIDKFSVLQEDGNFKLLELKHINMRTLVCWLNTDDGIISIALFHNNEKPNSLSSKASLTQWGYPTYFISDMIDEKEAAKVVTLYLKDMLAKKFWWEIDKS